ncbi:MAG: hypothetical protein Q8Q09_25885 [Deltaproteobacteria bacterium]|nr:hypothetical protein [Deltaproteobacteria bacterium]
MIAHRTLVVCGLLALVEARCAHRSPQWTLAMEPLANSNHSRAIYVIARSVTAQQFATQDYRTVAALVEAPDSTVRATIVVLPGRATSTTIRLAPNDRIAIYGFFSDVGGAWRVLLDSNTAETSVRLRVTDNSLEVLPNGR